MESGKDLVSIKALSAVELILMHSVKQLNPFI